MATEKCAQCGSDRGVMRIVFASAELEVALKLKGDRIWETSLCKACWMAEHGKASADDLLELLYDALCDRNNAEDELVKVKNDLEEAQNDAASFYSELQALRPSHTTRIPRDTQDALKVVEEIQSGSYAEGEEEGLKRGFTEGKEEGLSEGKKEGLDEGFDKGYDEGYQEGMKDAQKSQEIVHGC